MNLLRNCACLAVFTVLLCGQAWGHATYTAEPSGATPFYECAMTSNLCGMQDSYNSYGPYFGAWGGSGTMTSPPNSLKSQTNGGVGNGQGDLTLPGKPREVFLGMTWRTETSGYSNNNNKIIFIKNPSNSFLVMQGSQGKNCKTLKWYQQERVNNEHVPGNSGNNYPVDGTGWFNPLVNPSASVICWGGPYITVQIYLKGSTTNTSKDGIIMLWVNGQLTTHITNVNQGTDLSDFPGGFRHVSWNHAWDGSAGTSQAPFFEQWRHYLEHLYISLPNGGVVVPPQDTTPPSTPTLQIAQAMGVLTVSGVGLYLFYVAVSFRPRREAWYGTGEFAPIQA